MISRMYEGLYDSRAIFVSNYEAASDLLLLRSLKINAVVSVGQEFTHSYPSSIVPAHLKIPAIDREDFPLQSYFDPAYDFIQKAQQSGNVLIHCAVGVSRSVTIFLMYLIRKMNYPLSEALAIAKRRRPIINPNKGFLQALMRQSQKFAARPSKPQNSLRHYNSEPLKTRKTILKRGYSLGQSESSCSRNVSNDFKDKESLSPGEDTSKKDHDFFGEIMERKALVESKLQKIQSYYKERSSSRGRGTFFRLNSCTPNLDSQLI